MLLNFLKQQAATAVVIGRLVQAKSSCYGGVRISQQVPVRAFRARLYGEMVPRECIVRQVRRSPVSHRNLLHKAEVQKGTRLTPVPTCIDRAPVKLLL